MTSVTLCSISDVTAQRGDSGKFIEAGREDMKKVEAAMRAAKGGCNKDAHAARKPSQIIAPGGLTD